MSPPEKRADLDRVRDNQRRSRARRKEYQQELEARLLKYKLQGIEVSVELQAAARKVLDDNKKLRILLAQCGFTEDAIESYLQNSLPDHTTAEAQHGGIALAAQHLEYLLQAQNRSFTELDVDTSAQRFMSSEPEGQCSSSDVSASQLTETSAGPSSEQAAMFSIDTDVWEGDWMSIYNT